MSTNHERYEAVTVHAGTVALAVIGTKEEEYGVLTLTK